MSNINTNCEICNKKINSHITLLNHIEKDHKDTNIEDYLKKYFPEEVDKKTCPECNKDKYLFLFHRDIRFLDQHKKICIECSSRKKYNIFIERDKKFFLFNQGLKKCSKCSKVKKLQEFSKDKHNEDGCTSQCLECRRENGERYKNKIEEERQNGLYEIEEKKCHKCHHIKKVEDFNKSPWTIDGYDTKCKECVKQYRLNNKEYLKNKNKEYRKNNQEKLKKKGKEYRQRNKDKIRVIKREENRKRRKNPEFKFWEKNRSRIYQFLQAKKRSKSKSTKKLIGYSYKTFMDFMINNPNRIEKGYTFEDYHKGILTLDHIIPISKFDATEKDVKLAYQLKNLRLVTQSVNCSKIDKIDLDLIKKFGLEDLYDYIIDKEIKIF